MTTSDLYVEPVSHALAGKKIEVIVTGSIGAVESVRFVRALRRLGASVHVTLSKGAAQFVTPLALEWASSNAVQTDFSGTASHVASGDACVIAPASANFLQKLAAGITDTPSSALATSYCGAGKPVVILPSMHSSLADAPAVQENLKRVATWGVIIPPREEEGKRKFPDPANLADQVAHYTNRKPGEVLVAFGGTKAYLDDVRFLGNYSSGALGTAVTEELFRRGFNVLAVVGTAEVVPASYSSLVRIETNEELACACHDAISNCDALVFAPAVLDYIPATKATGKIRSGSEDLQIALKPTKKIIAELHPRHRIKVGFKLEANGSDEADYVTLAHDYCTRYELSLLVVNQLADVSTHKHDAVVFEAKALNAPESISGKQALANRIADHVERGLA